MPTSFPDGKSRLLKTSLSDLWYEANTAILELIDNYEDRYD